MDAGELVTFLEDRLLECPEEAGQRTVSFLLSHYTRTQQREDALDVLRLVAYDRFRQHPQYRGEWTPPCVL